MLLKHQQLIPRGGSGHQYTSITYMELDLADDVGHQGQAAELPGVALHAILLDRYMEYGAINKRSIYYTYRQNKY